MEHVPVAPGPTTVSRSRVDTVARRTAWTMLLVLPLLVSFWGVQHLPLYTKGEARESVQVWSELHGGGWILPLRNGVEVPSKPPLFHWLAGGAAMALGRLDEFSMRLPSLLIAAFAALAIAWAGMRRWDAVTGVAAGAVLATSFEWLRAARSARVDMTLAGCITAALLCLERMVTQPVPSRAALVGFYGSMALAVLAKGPVGYVLPMLVLLAYLAVTRDLARLWRLRPVSGSLLALGIPALWYVAAAVVGGEAFIAKQVLKENVFRFVGAGAMRHSHAHPFWYHGPAFLASFLPWSVFVAPLIAWIVRERRKLADDGRLFYVVWLVAVFVFYSIPSSKRSVYTLPAYPAAAVLMARWWSDVMHGRLVPHALWRFLAAALPVGAGLLGIALVVAALGGAGIRPGHAEWSLDVRGALAGIATHWPLALTCAVAALGGGYVLARSLRARRWDVAFAAQVLTTCAVTTFVVGAVEPGMAASTTMRPIMREVRRLVPPTAPLYFFGGHPDYEVVFYADRHLPTLRRREIDRVGAAEPDARVLLFEERWTTLPPAIRMRLRPIIRSEASRDERRGRLILASIAPAGTETAPEERSPGDVGVPEMPVDPQLFR